MRSLLEAKRIRKAGNSRRHHGIVAVLLVCFIVSADLTAQDSDLEKGDSGSPIAQANKQSGNLAAPEKEIVINGETVSVPDVWLVTQDGKSVRFYSDLIKDKAVVIGFFYTSCVFLCTRHGEFFSSIQRQVGARLGKEIFLVSLSMDPKSDTPARLRKWGTTYRRKQGWTLVTGQAKEVEKLLKILTGNPIGQTELHSTLFYVTNQQTARWSHMSGYPALADIERQVEGLVKP